MAPAEHSDGTPCPGATCAWAGDGGHRPVPVSPPRDRCPKCGDPSRLYDLDRVTQMQNFTVEVDGSKSWHDTPDTVDDAITTVGIYCRACDWVVEWGEDPAKALDLDDLLLTEAEFEASAQRDENAKIDAARREALRLMREN